MANVHLQRIAIRTPEFRNARRHWSQREAILLTLRSEGGSVVGYGEASPLPGFSSETLDAVELCLRRVGPIQLRSGTQPFEAPLFEAPMPAAARFCVESALLTAHCRELGVSLEQGLRTVVSAATPLANTELEPVASAALLYPLTEDAHSLALAAANAGTRVLKVKVGRDLDAETRVLTSIVQDARSSGYEIALRLDANQTLSLSSLAGLARSWRHLPIEYLEEACTTAELLATRPRRVELPLALDESLTAGVSALRPWLDSGQVRALVCKPMYLGGITVTSSWTKLAHEYGVPAVMSHLFDGPWARRIYEALARVLSPGVVAGLSAHPALPAWRQALGDLTDVTLEATALV